MWCAWGVIIATIVLWLDHDQISAAIWASAGIAIGTCSIRLFQPLAFPVFNWYHNFASDPSRDQRLVQLAMEEQTDTPEFKRLCTQDAIQMLMIAPPMCGLFHGVLLGGIGGVLCKLDRTFDLTAAKGALFGMLFGALGISFIASVVFAIMIPTDKTQSFTCRLAQRVLMLASPLLVFPVAWHCVKWILRRRPKNFA